MGGRAIRRLIYVLGAIAALITIVEVIHENAQVFAFLGLVELAVILALAEWVFQLRQENESQRGEISRVQRELATERQNFELQEAEAAESFAELKAYQLAFLEALPILFRKTSHLRDRLTPSHLNEYRNCLRKNNGVAETRPKAASQLRKLRAEKMELEVSGSYVIPALASTFICDSVLVLLGDLKRAIAMLTGNLRYCQELCSEVTRYAASSCIIPSMNFFP